MPEVLSDLIGLIYDCVVEPDRWPDTIGEICRQIGCVQGVIMDIDLIHSAHRFLSTWGIGADWTSRYLEHGEEVTATYRAFSEAPRHPIDEPLLLYRHVPDPAMLASRIYNEWVRPQHLCDFIQNIVLRAPGRLGVFAASRHEGAGILTDREIATLRLLAPHIRRAVTIGDILDRKKLEAHALAATLDNLAAGIAVIAEDNKVLYANAAADRMLAAGDPVRAASGRLSARDTVARAELSRAVALARDNEAGIGATGIGVALRGAGGEPAIAHVLPLARGDVRTRLMPQATAALFISQAEALRAPDTKALAQSFGLTPMEARVLARLAIGNTLAEAARALAIAETTAKTHLGNIFAKTGVARQADLIALVHRLAPPLRQNGGRSARGQAAAFPQDPS